MDILFSVIVHCVRICCLEQLQPSWDHEGTSLKTEFMLMMAQWKDVKNQDLWYD